MKQFTIVPSRSVIGGLGLLALLGGCAPGDNDGGAADAPIQVLPTDDACDRALAHVASCFPDQAAPATCDAATAAQVAATPCDVLTSADAKADNPWMCLWTPWACGGDGGGNTPSSGGRTITVSVERCLGGVFGADTCDGVGGAPCSLVVLEDAAGVEVARAYTGDGSVHFEGIGAEAHTARVLDRAGNTATAVFGDYAPEVAPAQIAVAAGTEDTKVYLYLQGGGEDTVRACSTVRGNLDVFDAEGTRLDAETIEWGWLVRSLEADGTVAISRPFRVHPEASDSGAWENDFSLHQVFPGEHLVEFIQMDIPEYARRNNPDYAQLLRLYAVSSVEIEALTLSVAADDVPEDLYFEYAITLPAAE